MKRKKIVWASITGLLIILIITGYIYRDNFTNPPEVKVYNAHVEEIKRYVSEEGEVKAKESEGIYSKLTGNIDKIYFDIGDKVKKGDLVAQFDSSEIDLNIEIVQRKIETLEATQNISEIDVIKSNLNEAERKLNNAEKLLGKGAITQESYNELLGNYNVLEKQLEVARKKYVAQNSATNYQLRELYAQLELQKNNKQKIYVSSDVNGVITDKLIEKNQAVNYGQLLFNVANTDTIYIEADILTKEIAEVKVGDYVEIEEEDLNIEGAGKISKIHPKAFNKVNDLGVEQKRVKIEISPDKTYESLRLGFECNVNVLVDKINDKIVIPENAIFNINSKDYVFLVKDNKVIRKEVKIVFYGDEMVAVNGLNNNDKVIASPTNDIEEGMTVEEIESMDE